MKLSERLSLKSNNVTFIKFVCALFVIFSHSYAVAQGKDDVVAIFNKGQCNIGGIAVAVFFFYSGLYVTKSLAKDTSAISFMKKRCKRIFPQLWIVVLLSAFVLGPIVTSYSMVSYFTDKATYIYLINGLLIPIHDLPGVFSNNPYTTVNGPLWTMIVEFVGYCGLAVIMWFAVLVGKKDSSVKKKTERVLHLLAFLFTFAIMMVLIVSGNEASMLVSVARALCVFFEGALFYDYSERIKLNWIVGACFCLVMICLCKTGLFNMGMVLLFPYAICSISLGLKQIPKLPGLLNASYEMYLCGWPIQQIVVLFFNGNMMPWLNFLITMPLDILLGWLIMFMVEKSQRSQRRKKV